MYRYVSVDGYGFQKEFVEASDLRNDMAEIPVSSCVAKDKNKCENLWEAVRLNHVQCVEELLKQGLDVNHYYHTYPGGSLLAQATARFKLELAHLLLRQPDIDVNIKDNFGKTALFLCFESGVVPNSFVVDLIKNGLDINAQDSEGFTALHYAVYHEEYEIVHLLLYYGADVSIQCYSGGLTPFANALLMVNHDIADILIDFYDFQFEDEDITCFEMSCNGLLYLLSHNHIAIFNTVGARLSFSDDFISCFQYLISRFLLFTPCSTSQWIREFYLIFQSETVFKLIPRSSEEVSYPLNAGVTGCLIPYCHFIQAFLSAIHERKVNRNDTISLISVVLSWGMEICLHCFSKTLELYGFGEELEAFLYMGSYSRTSVMGVWQVAGLPPLSMVRSRPTNLFLPVWILGLETDTTISNFLSLLRNEDLLDAYLFRPMNLINCLRYFTFPADVAQNLVMWCKNSIVDELHKHEINKTLMNGLERASAVPPLLELSRNATRVYVKQSYKILRPYQFHDIVKSLPVPERIKDIIRFKSPLY